MRHWDYKKIKENKSKEFICWKLERQVNFGEDKGKLNLNLLKKYWDFINIDPLKRRFLELIIWGKKF